MASVEATQSVSYTRTESGPVVIKYDKCMVCFLHILGKAFAEVSHAPQSQGKQFLCSLECYGKYTAQSYIATVLDDKAKIPKINIPTLPTQNILAVSKAVKKESQK